METITISACCPPPLCQNSCHLWRPQPDWSIIFSADIAGIYDIRIWVLSWGPRPGCWYRKTWNRWLNQRLTRLTGFMTEMKREPQGETYRECFYSEAWNPFRKCFPSGVTWSLCRFSVFHWPMDWKFENQTLWMGEVQFSYQIVFPVSLMLPAYQTDRKNFWIQSPNRYHCLPWYRLCHRNRRYRLLLVDKIFCGIHGISYPEILIPALPFNSADNVFLVTPSAFAASVILIFKRTYSILPVDSFRIIR